MMSDLPTFSLDEIRRCLKNHEFPLEGITGLGSTEFHISEPAHFMGVALHAGHRVRPEILDLMAISEADRHREEDPLTDLFIKDFPIRIVALDSRFEYDLNREPERSVYSSERGIWGLDIWKRKVEGPMRAFTLQKHREFNDLLDMVVEFMLEYYEQLLVYDMHSYCYQRQKKQKWFEDPRPEINLGTVAVNRDLFAPFIEVLLKLLGEARVDGHRIRVAENEIFPGGYLSRRLSKAYYDRVLVLALEYKKLFMDEWSGELYGDKLEMLISNFKETVDIVNSL
jgi:N-formylglutamate deformylase